jgi:prevent-host-death family protein
MPTIGVQELREQTSEVLRQVREAQAKYIITYQGKPVALLLPVQAEVVEKTMVEAEQRSVADGWETYARLAEELRRDWPADKSTQELMDEIRR